MTIISTTGAGCLAKHAPQRDPHALSRVSLSNFFSTPPHPVRIPRLRTHREIDWWRGHAEMYPARQAPTRPMRWPRTVLSRFYAGIPHCDKN